MMVPGVVITIQQAKERMMSFNNLLTITKSGFPASLSCPHNKGDSIPYVAFIHVVTHLFSGLYENLRVFSDWKTSDWSRVKNPSCRDPASGLIPNLKI